MLQTLRHRGIAFGRLPPTLGKGCPLAAAAGAGGGEQGWEMAGCGSLAFGADDCSIHVTYFQRPIE